MLYCQGLLGSSPLVHISELRPERLSERLQLAIVATSQLAADSCQESIELIAASSFYYAQYVFQCTEFMHSINFKPASAGRVEHSLWFQGSIENFSNQHMVLGATSLSIRQNLTHTFFMYRSLEFFGSRLLGRSMSCPPPAALSLCFN